MTTQTVKNTMDPRLCGRVVDQADAPEGRRAGGRSEATRGARALRGLVVGGAFDGFARPGQPGRREADGRYHRTAPCVLTGRRHAGTQEQHQLNQAPRNQALAEQHRVPLRAAPVAGLGEDPRLSPGKPSPLGCPMPNFVR